jgi:2',3'-cyclic-nucleotide 2'-phosphodiesterase
MRILFLGDVVGNSGCEAIFKNLQDQIKLKKIDFVIVNGENAAEQGVGITSKISNNFFDCGIDVITTGNHVWDQKEAMDYIEKEPRLLRPQNLISPSPGKGFEVFQSKNGLKVGVLNLMGNIFMKKSEDVFVAADKFIKNNLLKKDYDFLVVDFHGEITSEKMAMGHLFDGYATLVVGTHTHVPTNDARLLKKGTAYQTDAGMCGDYDSVIGMNKENSISRFLKKKSTGHFPATNEATLCGVIVDCDIKTGLAKNIENFVYGGELRNSL